MIVGLGNPLFGDDAVGLLVARRVHRLLSIPALELRQLTAGGVELMETLIGCSAAVIIDAIVTPRGNPGDLYLLDIEDFPPTRHACASHEIGLLQGLELARRLRLPIPRCLRIYAVEVPEPAAFGNRLTREVRKSIPGISRSIVGEVRPLFQE